MARVLLVALCLFLTAISSCRDDGTDDPRPRDSTVTVEASSDDASDTVIAGATDAETREPATVSADRFGPIRIGMTADELKRIRPDVFVVNAIGPNGLPISDSCYFLALPPVDRQQATMFMIIGDEVARVEIGDSTIATREGARIGDSEQRIKELYSGSVTVQKHAYTDGNYLIVARGDGRHRIVFETDGRTVTTYRAGRMPEVEWVEGCS